METTMEGLTDLFNKQLLKFKRHVFNIKLQFAFTRALKKELASHECIIHVDFSENYRCKYSSEVQALYLVLHINKPLYILVCAIPRTKCHTSLFLHCVLIQTKGSICNLGASQACAELHHA